MDRTASFDEFIKSLQDYSEETLARFDEDEDNEGIINDDEYLFDYGNMNPYANEPDIESNPGANYVQVGSAKEEDISLKYITDEDIQKYSSMLYPEKKVLRSLILEFFTPEMIFEIEKLTRTFSISNNKKKVIIEEKLKEWGIPFAPLGPGTNRLGILLDGYVIKIALDPDGKIDNCREFIYSMQLQPYVIKCYEVSPNGVLGVFEYVEVFSLDDFYKNQSTMREILTEIAANFLIGDVGVSSVNYLNWGYRGTTPVILDFAYIYSVAFRTFTCGCSPDAILHYDKDFNNLICPICGKKYAFKDIRKKISRKDQEEEIGDITKKGYVISSSEEEVNFNPSFTEGAKDRIYKKLIKIQKRRNQKLKWASEQQVVDHDQAMDVEEIAAAIARGELVD